MKKFFVFCVAVFSLYSCTSYSPAAEFSALADELQKNSSNYTTEEWEAAIASYQSIIDASEGYEFKDEELQEIGRQQGRCLSYITKGYAKIAVKAGSSYLQQLKGIYKGFSEEFGDGSDVAKDIENALNGLLNSTSN